MTATVIYSINYDGSDQKTFPPLFNSTTKTQPPFESITVTNGLLYFTIQRQLKSVKLSNGLPLIDTNRLVANLTSTTLSIQTISSDDGKTKSLCSTKNCEQFCFNFGDHAKCDCAYSRLSKNGQSCERFASFIAFASGSKVEFTTTFDEQQDYKNISIDNELNRYEVQALKPIESFLKAPVAISVDTDRKVLFVSDIQTEQIVAIPFNQTQRIVISQNIRRVEGLAYDSHNKHLYLSSEKSIQRVNVSNLDEKILKHPEIVLELNRYDLVRGLAVNPCEGILYFTNWGLHTPAIEQVYFNGSGRHAIITTDIQTPNAVTVDYTAKKLYWLDARLGKF
jgi:integrin beta 2